MSTNATNSPVDTHFDGPTFAKVWRNTNQNNEPFYNTTVGRIYTDKNGDTQETRNLSDGDLLKLPGLAARARETVRHFKAQDRQRGQTQSHGNSHAQTEREQFRQSRQRQAPAQDQEQSPQP
ncbi:hypothetical protein [uncultured Erythrobacter sp.]|uniref:hypothetical protein n=1 Tax=uncultured Erythrobacter sp. TaxID=263913 RepID=UPI002636C01E|nr:hypothetical protein [uncultured Erythrobacter sp.]